MPKNEAYFSTTLLVTSPKGISSDSQRKARFHHAGQTLHKPVKIDWIEHLSEDQSSRLKIPFPESATKKSCKTEFATFTVIDAHQRLLVGKKGFTNFYGPFIGAEILQSKKLYHVLNL